MSYRVLHNKATPLKRGGLFFGCIFQANYLKISPTKFIGEKPSNFPQISTQIFRENLGVFVGKLGGNLGDLLGKMSKVFGWIFGEFVGKYLQDLLEDSRTKCQYFYHSSLWLPRRNLQRSTPVFGRFLEEVSAEKFEV